MHICFDQIVSNFLWRLQIGPLSYLGAPLDLQWGPSSVDGLPNMALQMAPLYATAYVSLMANSGLHVG